MKTDSSSWKISTTDPKQPQHNVEIKGTFTIIDIYESVQRLLFLITPSPKCAYSSDNINSNMHRHVALHRSTLKMVKRHNFVHSVFVHKTPKLVTIACHF